MLSDERLVKIEQFVSESLNEDASLQKVRFPLDQTKGEPTPFNSDRNRRGQRPCVRREGNYVVLYAWNHI
jgi:hypothetical protein